MVSVITCSDHVCQYFTAAPAFGSMKQSCSCRAVDALWQLNKEMQQPWGSCSSLCDRCHRVFTTQQQKLHRVSSNYKLLWGSLLFQGSSFWMQGIDLGFMMPPKSKAETQPESCFHGAATRMPRSMTSLM